MELKLHLNKFLKVDNIENYTLKTLKVLQSTYQDFIEKAEGIDPDYPMFTFGGKGKRIKGNFGGHLNIGEDTDDQQMDLNEFLGL